jgi:hypothetical protein
LFPECNRKNLLARVKIISHKFTVEVTSSRVIGQNGERTGQENNKVKYSQVDKNEKYFIILLIGYIFRCSIRYLQA